MKIRLLLLFFAASISGFSQDYFPANTSVKTSASHYQAITNATLHPAPNQQIDNGTILFKNGTIIAVGQNINIPENTLIHDYSGKHIYASFVELHSDFGIKSETAGTRRGRSTQYDANREGYYWNDHIQSDYNGIKEYSYDKAGAKKLRNAGFGVVNSHRTEGIHRGTSVFVALNDMDTDAIRLLDEKAAQHLSFTKSRESSQYYPGSIMGAMALLRQFFHDADWYKKGGASNKDLAIEAFNANKNLPAFFEARNKLDVARAAKIGKEFGLPFTITASGKEYEHIQNLKDLNATLLVPVNFPDGYDVTDPVSTQKIALSDMRYWNQAPMNPAEIAKGGIPFAFTSNGLSDKTALLKNIKKAINYGLDKEKALAALTTTPARLLGKQADVGQLKKAALANFIVTNGPLFEDSTKIEENWVQGRQHKIITSPEVTFDGKYTLMLDGEELSLVIKNSGTKIAATVKKDSVKLTAKATYKSGWMSLQIQNEAKDAYAQLSAKISDANRIDGEGTSFDGNSIRWTARFNQAAEDKKKTKKENKQPTPVAVTYPNNGFGFSSLPTAQNTLFKNATVWTNEAEGILKNTDVWVENGKIKAIGQNLNAPGAVEIDATGKHLSSGIIDEHSHIGASSINEGGHNSSAEVTIEDVINPDDINLYRNLSGGVTTLQILHGSANPIGGRSAIIKPRWGEDADGLLYRGAAPFIKFALGENVKQSNWSSYARFPQTRMGVEQVFVDYFQRAKEYQTAWKTYNALGRKTKAKTLAPRYDLEMETLVEILEGKRFISCHSYVQSEINMLMKVAERFGVTINTFTHILEGYKVADKMKEHGVGGSTFSDWWAYKFEVNDAIPYNGAIMHSQGVTVAFNSDDAEMSRRLNQEAAKAVKYGGVSEEDAWKFVTLNPAKLMHIDDQVGSVKVGKSADLVLWNDHPMSIYAVAEKTMIEGIFYYELDRATAQTEKIQQERNQLIQQMVEAKNGGAPTQKAPKKQAREFHCETLD
ncbi:amidohydrolase family protein [Flavobacteriaceae bacterium]|nr:amidohydrolase family protein [Flavobacteriaceae bacterium]